MAAATGQREKCITFMLICVRAQSAHRPRIIGVISNRQTDDDEEDKNKSDMLCCVAMATTLIKALSARRTRICQAKFAHWDAAAVATKKIIQKVERI